MLSYEYAFIIMLSYKLSLILETSYYSISFEKILQNSNESDKLALVLTYNTPQKQYQMLLVLR